MLRLRHAATRTATAAAEMPWVDGLRPFYESGVKFRHGQLIMVAGFPGAMKSAFAMWLCNQWNLPTMYLSADMAEHTFVSRMGSMRTGWSHEDVTRLLADGGDEADFIRDELDQSNVVLVADDAPALTDIEDEINAWVELYDDYPKVVVIDNLVDLDLEDLGDSEFRAWLSALLWLKSLCRETGATVLVLHHARELGKSDYPAPRRDIQGKVSQTPELTISVSLTPDNQFRASVVKNRNGRQDAMAREGVEYRAVPERMDFVPVGRWQRGEKD